MFFLQSLIKLSILMNNLLYLPMLYYMYGWWRLRKTSFLFEQTYYMHCWSAGRTLTEIIRYLCTRCNWFVISVRKILFLSAPLDRSLKKYERFWNLIFQFLEILEFQNSENLLPIHTGIHQSVTPPPPPINPTLITKKTTFSSYMTKYFRIYFATAPIWISSYMKQILFYFFISVRGASTPHPLYRDTSQKQQYFWSFLRLNLLSAKRTWGLATPRCNIIRGEQNCA
jgi:hypothetical protein